MLPEGARQRLAVTTRFGDVRWFAEIDSTNRYLLEEARGGAAEGVVAVADYQTSGRGRMGRTWMAPPGSSLLMSVLLRPLELGLVPDEFHLVTSACSLATATACRTASGVTPALKWPNDLLAGGRKLAGVLAEAEPGALVVGVGLNVNWPPDPPPELTEIAVALNQLSGDEVDRVELLIALLTELERRLEQIAGGQAGRQRLMTDYRTACTTLGQTVRVTLAAGASVLGEATTIDDKGHLFVLPATGESPVEVIAGDVVHLRPEN